MDNLKDVVEASSLEGLIALLDGDTQKIISTARRTQNLCDSTTLFALGAALQRYQALVCKGEVLVKVRSLGTMLSEAGFHLAEDDVLTRV